jgi:hypothetical protein
VVIPVRPPVDPGPDRVAPAVWPAGEVDDALAGRAPEPF